MRTAVILLALLALAAIPGSLLPQRGVASDPFAVTQYQRDHPDLAPWLDRFGMFEVYASPWFAAIYILLLVSMTGCVLPRTRQLWRSARSSPPAAPRNLARLHGHRSWSSRLDAEELLDTAARHLRRRGFRVVMDADQVRAEKGYLREVGNLMFHLSLLVLLFGVAAGKLLGYEGRVAVIEGSSFTNVRALYDGFARSPWTDVDDLEPFTLRLEDFMATYELTGPKAGEPRDFKANISYRTSDSSPERQTTVSPNQPLVVRGTKVFLTGHGYAPKVTVRDGTGAVVFTGPVIFLPKDSALASDGVVKAPDARPVQIAFQGTFLPTAAIDESGPYSAFPKAIDPQLFLTAFTGDLGLGDGTPQSVFTLDKSGLSQVQTDDKPFSQALSPGETMSLPDGNGSLTFDGLAQFANFQIAYDPGKEVSLVAAVLLLVGLTMSLAIPRRRLWVRVTNTDDGNHIELASLPLARREAPVSESRDLIAALDGPTTKSPEDDGT
ncbi:cytochrome c biogenesis protein ResB [Nocardioides sp. NPDC057767]|nr:MULTISPECIES: cytochrome c biogenesis protein ResB [Nocardioides]